MRYLKALVIAWTAILLALAALFPLPHWYEKHSATLVEVVSQWQKRSVEPYRRQIVMRYAYVVEGREYRGSSSLPPASDASNRGWMRKHPVGSTVEVEVFRPEPSISTYDASGGFWTSTFILYAVIAWLATVPPLALAVWLGRGAVSLAHHEGRRKALRAGKRMFNRSNAAWLAVAWGFVLLGLAWWYSQPDHYEVRTAIVEDVGPGSSPRRPGFAHLSYDYEFAGRTHGGMQSIELGTAQLVRRFANAHPVGSRVQIQVFRPQPWLSAYEGSFDHWFRTLALYGVIVWLVTVPLAALLGWVVSQIRNRR